MRESSDWRLGKISSLKCWPGIGTGSSGQQWSHRAWNCSEGVWDAVLGDYGGAAGLMVGMDDPRRLFPPQQCYNPLVPSHPYLDVLMQLCLVLPGELLMLPLELRDQDLPLDLLLLLEGQQLLLQLLLAQCGLRHRHGELVVQPQVHGH